MNPSNGNSVLLVDTDRVYAFQLRDILVSRGAMVSLSHTVAAAKKLLNDSDYDLVISCHKFPDGNIRDLFEWCKSSLSSLPALAALGNCTPFEKKQLEKLGVENFFSKVDSPALFEDISRALFNFETFRKNILESSFEKGISYELKVGSAKISAKALEIMDQGVFLSFESPFSFGDVAILELTCSADIEIQPLSVKGTLQGEFSEGQFFKVNMEDYEKWEALLSQLDRKQEKVTEFLKKASGK
jgi:DNA-binding NtrC family response regulator